MDTNGDLELALHLADKADELSREAYHALDRVSVRVKADGSPVTNVDIAVERAIAEAVAAQRPRDAVLGEEVGQLGGEAARTWIIDGIDGTSSFMDGGSMWSTQIALVVDGAPHLGVSTSPAQRRRWWGGIQIRSEVGELGRRRNGRPLAVSTTTSRHRARITSIPPRDALHGSDRELVDRLVADGRYVEPEIHGAKLVSQADADACVQLRGGPWDFAALAAIVLGAGGHFTDLDGNPGLGGGGPCLYSNGLMHEQLLATATG